MPSQPAALFTYGTLMPGHLRWPVLASHATGWRHARVAGRLYDTGRGWPAATLDDSSARTWVPGVIVDLDPGTADDLLVALDELEGVPHLFHRIVVESDIGVPAWAWSCVEATDRFRPVDRWSGDRER